MLPLAPFGRTGHQSTRLIFGAAALGGMSQDRADATLEIIDAAGVNHIDTAASYGASEDRLKPWLAMHRGEVFLATKTGERGGDAARAELERSLTRMAVDHVDLIQLHNLVEPEEWDAAHAPDGVLAALVKARDEGLVRFVGVTGHGVRIAGMHRRSLERFDYDSVLLPFNFTMLDRLDYRADVEALLETCASRNVAVQTIKSIARGRWAPDTTERKFSWYEPLTDPDAIGRSVRWLLGHPQLFLNSTSAANQLPSVLAAAASAAGQAPPTDDEMRSDTDTFGITALFDNADLERI